MRIAPVTLIVLSVFSLCCCGPKDPEKLKEAAYLVVNRQIDNHEITVSSEGVYSEFSVKCDAAWEIIVPEDVTWVSVGEKVSAGKESWTIPYSVGANTTQFPRSTSVKFTAGEHECVVTITQGAPDPLTLNKVPGLYGLDSGSITVTGNRQSSSFHYGGIWAYRIIDPYTLTVFVLSGIPEIPVPGTTVTLKYKKVVQGLVESLEVIEDVEIVRNLSGMVWLRKSDTQFFIVEK